MCCFSQPVTSVSATNIFARPADSERQFLVYSMALESRYDLAMILPLPVKTRAAEEDVKFINLKEYPHFFDQLNSGFPVRPARELVDTAGVTESASLKVQAVGDFEASFVPTVNDFSRLDPKFQLPKDAWNKLPAYQDYGFAVFKLKRGWHTIQPMAFSFPPRDPRLLFFPTVHIHDGKVHPQAYFDHLLYCQPSVTRRPPLLQWKESSTQAKNFVDIRKALGIVNGEEHCYKYELKGSLPNRDTVLKMS